MTIMFAVLGVGIVFALALIVDGGRQLGALTQAQHLADNAARAGSQEVDLDVWRTTGVPDLDPARAEAEARAFLFGGVASGRVQIVDVTVAGPDITVEVIVNRELFLLATRPARAVESASALDGITESTP